MVPTPGNVGPPNGLDRRRHMRVQRVGQVVARDDDQRDLVPRRHDSEPAGLQVELAGLDDASQRVNDDHHPTFEAPPTFRGVSMATPFNHIQLASPTWPHHIGHSGRPSRMGISAAGNLSRLTVGRSTEHNPPRTDYLRSMR